MAPASSHGRQGQPCRLPRDATLELSADQRENVASRIAAEEHVEMTVRRQDIHRVIVLAEPIEIVVARELALRQETLILLAGEQREPRVGLRRLCGEVGGQLA